MCRPDVVPVERHPPRWGEGSEQTAVLLEVAWFASVTKRPLPGLPPCTRRGPAACEAADPFSARVPGSCGMAVNPHVVCCP